MKKLGVTASVTLMWPELDILQSVFYNPRLGFDRAYFGTYPFQSMFDKGINVSTGADFPVSTPEYNIHTYTGLTRLLPPNKYEEFFGDPVKFPYTTDLNNVYTCSDFPTDITTDPIPIGPQRPNLGDPNDQRIYPLNRLIHSYTLASAKQLLLTKRVGTIECGKDANIVVWDTNWFQYAKKYKTTNDVADLDPVSTSQVDMTIFQGRIVYSSGAIINANTARQTKTDFSKLHMHVC